MAILITALSKFIGGLVAGLIGPIDQLIAQYLPNVNIVLGQINDFFDWLCNFVVWVCSWLPFTTTFYSFLATYFLFRLTLPLLVSTIKHVVQWWHALAP